ncbi:hypothetical protein BGZ46_003058 [Entomortierella lignicola]|nr:hypothetical protein BGZ46_003058 [Entomortierella lignicola]
MSYSTSPAELSPQPFVLSSPDRVLVRALPLPLPSTNKKVTLSLRRTTQSQNTTQPPSLLNTTTSRTEPSTVPQNSQIANTRQHHTMISTLTSSIQEQDVILPPQCVTATHQTHKLERPSPSPLVTTATLAIVGQPIRDIGVTRKHSAQFHKNGLPIKSALKSPAITKENLGPATPNRPLTMRSLSSPTPLTSPKYVHFNTQLEHVRLFLQGEMPSCVSERETIVDARQHDRSTSDIKISLPNWTPSSVDAFKPVDIDSGAAPMRVESVILSEDQTQLQGKILVQNIAFHKHVSVRYTSDFWQTHAEVSAEFEQSISGSSLDRFMFTVPLNMDRSAVEKSICMAVRYQVIGREFWDSNNGKNYQIECKRVIVVPPSQAVSDLSKHMNTLLLGSPLPDYSKPVLRKKLANRYDLSTSLSAAYSQPSTVPVRSSNLKTDNKFIIGTPASQTAYRASEYIIPTSVSPQNYHHSLYASSPKFFNSYLSAASPPDHFQVGYDQVSLDHAFHNKKAAQNNWSFEVETPHPLPQRSQSFPNGFYSTSPKGSAPISIPSTRAPASRPSVGSSSYFDLVDRYCFYQSSPHTSPYSSYPNSPPAPCIQG